MLEVIKGTKEITKFIKAIATSGKTLDDRIQLAAMSTINHAAEHGDVTLCCELFKAMPQGARSKALTDWFLMFGPVKVNRGKNAKELPFVLDRDKVLNLEGANALPWYMCKVEKHPSEEFDLLGALSSLIKRAEAAAKVGKTIKGMEQIQTLRQMVGAQA